MNHYPSLRHKVEPFDLFFFSGSGIISGAIKLLTKSEWSHVAVALRQPQYDWNLLYESTTLTDLPDLTTGKPVKGVQLHWLSERIEAYDGKVAWLPIYGPKTDSQIYLAADFIRDYRGRPYEKNQLELLASVWDGIELIRQPDTSSVFCSEMAVELLRYVGVSPFQPNLPSNEYTPADLASPGLALVSDYTYGPLQIVKDG